MENVKLSAPWEIFYKEMKVMFGEDPDIEVVINNETHNVVLKVQGVEKADALTKLLPTEKCFGSVTVYIKVIPANKLGYEKATLFKKAFEGNPVFSFSTSIDDISSNPIGYVVFKNKVVQFYSDNLGDINGNTSTLYQEIAKDIFGNIDGIYYCTSINSTP